MYNVYYIMYNKTVRLHVYGDPPCSIIFVTFFVYLFGPFCKRYIQYRFSNAKGLCLKQKCLCLLLLLLIYISPDHLLTKCSLYL